MVLIARSDTLGCDNVIIWFIFSSLKYFSISVPLLHAPSLSAYTFLGFPTLLIIVLIASNISGIVLCLIGTIVINFENISIHNTPPIVVSLGKSLGAMKKGLSDIRIWLH